MSVHDLFSLSISIFPPNRNCFNGRASVCAFFSVSLTRQKFCFIVLRFQGSSRSSTAISSIDEPSPCAVALHPKQFSEENVSEKWRYNQTITRAPVTPKPVITLAQVSFRYAQIHPHGNRARKNVEKTEKSIKL